MPAVTIKDWGKGVNRDQHPSELTPGFWSDCANMRFRDGKAERVGGIADIGTPSVQPYWMAAYPSGATRYLVYAGTQKAYAFDGTTHTEITRYASASSAVQPIATLQRTSNVTTVTTSAAHGLTTGWTVRIYYDEYKSSPNAPTGTDGNGFSTTSAVITVTSTTTFTYANTGSNTSAVAPTAIKVWSYSVIAGGAISNFTGTQADKWTGGNLNGVIVMNNPVDGLLYWDIADGGKLHGFPGVTYKSDVARPFKNYVVQLAKTVSGVKYRHNLLWSNSAEPGSVPTQFVASDTNDAGEVDLVSAGEMVDCLEWGDDLIVYKRDVRFRVHYIGGNYVFDTHQISTYSQDDGLLAANCVVNTPVGQVFISNNRDIRIHAGGESRSLAEGRMLDSFRSRIDPTYQSRAFLTVNPKKCEVAVCFPEVGQTTCTKALLWNWNDDTWGERDLPNVTFGCAGLLPASISTSSEMVVCTTTPKFGLMDSGSTSFGATITSTLERTGMDFDDSDRYKTLHASRPRFDGAAAFSANVYHGSSATPDGAVTYSAAVTYTHNTTDRCYAFANSGRYVAWKMTTTAAEQPTLRSIDFFINLDGTD